MPAAQAGAGLPAPGGLDGIAPAYHGWRPSPELPLRAGSAADTEFDMDLGWYRTASDNAVFNPDGSITLAAAQGRSEWLIFEAFNAGSECEGITLGYTGLKDDLYLFIADYSTGRWQLQQQLPSGPQSLSVPLDEDRFYSPLHRQYFALLAADGGQLLLSSLKLQIEEPQQADSIAVQDSLPGFAVLDCGGRPGIAYRGLDSHIRFALAASGSPQLPLEWKHTEVIPDVSCIAFCAALFQGRPLVLYTSAVDGGVWLAISSQALPQEDTDWQLHKVFSNFHVNTRCAVYCEPQRLHFAYYEKDEADLDADDFLGYVGYGQSVSGDLLGEYSWGRLSGLGNAVAAIESQPAVCSFAGRPAVAVVNRLPGGSSNVLYLQAAAAEPEPGDWSGYELNNSAYEQQLRLDAVDGLPFILWNGSFLYGYHAQELDPPSELEWSAPRFSGGNVENQFSLGVVNGRPCVANVYEFGGVYRLTYSTCSPGAAPVDRSSGLRMGGSIEGFTEVPEPQIFSLGGRPGLAYRDAASLEIHFVRLVND